MKHTAAQLLQRQRLKRMLTATESGQSQRALMDFMRDILRIAPPDQPELLLMLWCTMRYGTAASVEELYARVEKDVLQIQQLAELAFGQNKHLRESGHTETLGRKH